MADLAVGGVAVVALFALVVLGVPIAFSLFVASLLGMLLLTGSVEQTAVLVSNTVLGGVRDYVFAVIPLFILMGAFMSHSPAARYLFDVARLVARRLIGGLASATVFANGIFGAVTGVSVASAAIFARIAVPEMVARGYDKKLALGTVAGSSVLGMLIPPSLLMILYGVLANVSIGTLFIAGIVPGVLLALVYVLTITAIGVARPERVGRPARPGRIATASPTSSSSAATEPTGTGCSSPALPTARTTVEDVSAARTMVRALPIGALIALVLGGIWLGWFTPTEAAAVGASGAFVVAVGYGMRTRAIVSAFRESAVSIGSIMLLLIGAQLFSRTLARSGLVTEMTNRITDSALSAGMVVLLFVVVLIVLGAVLDSSSILLIMVPLMAPVVTSLGLDPIWFAIIVIVAVEVGLLTPPFGMSPFAMSAVLGDRATVGEIFAGAMPFVLAMLLTLGLLAAFPPLVTWLPSLLG
ncbi:TRAP transporter large permease [Georgenia sp. Z1491]|uniref:TRAP transporter large permease n=1 Tax=Georgenia sp. Z1491 TaxID=3416707 RepID=UPI003CF53BCE